MRPSGKARIANPFRRKYESGDGPLITERRNVVSPIWGGNEQAHPQMTMNEHKYTPPT